MVRTRFNFYKKNIFIFVYLKFHFFFIDKDALILYKTYRHDFFNLVFFFSFYTRRFFFRNFYDLFFNKLVCKKIIYSNKYIYNYFIF